MRPADILRQHVTGAIQRGAAVAARRTEKADSFDRMAASCRALLRAPQAGRDGYAPTLAHESPAWFRAEYARIAESYMEADSQSERDELRRKVELLRAVAAFRFEGASIDGRNPDDCESVTGEPWESLVNGVANV